MSSENVVSLRAEEEGDPVAPESPVTQHRIDAARRWLLHYKDNTGKDWAVIGRELAHSEQPEGYSASSMSVFANGKYSEKSIGRILRTIEELRSLEEERSRVISQPEFAETSISKRVFLAIRKTQLLRRIGILAGESGTGKTTAIRQYASMTPKAIYVPCNPTLAYRPWPMLARLLASIGHGSGKRSSPAHAMMALVETLRGSGRILIIDEAQLLAAETLDLLRCLHEEAEIPLVLAGNEMLYELGPRGSGGSAAFVQFQSRCAVREKFSTTDLTATDVKVIAEQLVGVDLARGCKDLLLKQAKAAGGVRRLVMLLQIAQTLRKGDEAVTKQHVLSAMDEAPGHMGVIS